MFNMGKWRAFHCILCVSCIHLCHAGNVCCTLDMSARWMNYATTHAEFTPHMALYTGNIYTGIYCTAMCLCLMRECECECVCLCVRACYLCVLLDFFCYYSQTCFASNMMKPSTLQHATHMHTTISWPCGYSISPVDSSGLFPRWNTRCLQSRDELAGCSCCTAVMLLL